MRPQDRNLRPFPKGVSGNPGGRPRLPDHLAEISALTQAEVSRIVAMYARMKKSQLAEVLKGDLPMIEIHIASVFAQGAKAGSFAHLGFLLDRAIGKVRTDEGDQGSTLTQALAALAGGGVSMNAIVDHLKKGGPGGGA